MFWPDTPPWTHRNGGTPPIKVRQATDVAPLRENHLDPATSHTEVVAMAELIHPNPDYGVQR